MSTNPHHLLDVFTEDQDLAALRTGLASCADINCENSDGKTAIERCIENYIDIAVLPLVEAGADLGLALAASIRRRSTDLTLLLRCQGTDLGAAEIAYLCGRKLSRKTTLDLVFASRFFPFILREKFGPQVSTLLHLAARHDFVMPTFYAIVGRGALVDARDNAGNTPLHYALKLGNQLAVRALCITGASMKARNDYGLAAFRASSSDDQTTILHHLAEYDNDCAPKLIAECLGLGADARRLDALGTTPIEIAIRAGIAENARQFLLNGVPLPDHPRFFCRLVQFFSDLSEYDRDLFVRHAPHAARKKILKRFMTNDRCNQTFYFSTLERKFAATLDLLYHGFDPLAKKRDGRLVLAPEFGTTEEEILETVRRYVPALQARGAATKAAHEPAAKVPKKDKVSPFNQN